MLHIITKKYYKCDICGYERCISDDEELKFLKDICPACNDEKFYLCSYIKWTDSKGAKKVEF